LFEQLPDARALLVADLQEQDAVRLEELTDLFRDPAVDVQTVLPSVESDTRLVVFHVSVEGLVFRRAHVRRIAGDQIEQVELRHQRLEEIAVTQFDPFRELMFFDVLGGHSQGGLGNVRG
jgi:hypothetical protein